MYYKPFGYFVLGFVLFVNLIFILFLVFIIVYGSIFEFYFYNFVCKLPKGLYVKRLMYYRVKRRVKYFLLYNNMVMLMECVLAKAITYLGVPISFNGVRIVIINNQVHKFGKHDNKYYLFYVCECNYLEG